MRIAIDARELAGSPTGVGRYVSGLLAAWGELPAASAHAFLLCAPAGAAPAPPAGVHTVIHTAPGSGTLWEQFALGRLARSAGADVLFAPGYSGPVLSRVPMVVAIHDVSFAARPEWYAWREGLRRRLLTRWSAARAVRIITISDFSKREIVKHLGVDQSKVEVIYPGTAAIALASPKPAGEGGADAARGPSGAPTVLYTGSVFARRHLPELIEGFDRLASRHPAAHLEIVGDNRTRPHIDLGALVARSAARDHISVRSYVPDAELASCYARASAFAFLSEYEGFGLTPIEALSAGVPIVVLDTEVAREVYGPAAIYVARPDPTAIADALERAMFDRAERSRILDAAPAQLERYSWPECAQRTLQLLLACGGG